MSSPSTIYVVGRHGRHCKQLPDEFTIRINEHCKECRADIRLVGSPKTNLAGCKHDKLITHAAWEGDELADEIWIPNTVDGVTHLYFSDRGIINSLPFMPLTGLVGIQYALAIGAEQVIVAGMDFFKGQETVGPHYLPPQREMLKNLLATDRVKMFETWLTN